MDEMAVCAYISEAASRGTQNGVEIAIPLSTNPCHVKMPLGVHCMFLWATWPNVFHMFNVLLVVLLYFSSSPSLNIIADQRSSGSSLLNRTYSASLISAYIKAIVALCRSPNGMRPVSLACFVAQTQPQNEYSLGRLLNFSLYLL
jgi:hypothetical protein